MTTLQTALAELPCEEPTWIFPGRHLPRAELEEAAAFLSRLEPEDFALFVLAYGFGMRLGVVSLTLKLDPALVVWRIRRELARWRSLASADAGMLERAVSDLLRGAGTGLPPPPQGRSWLAKDLVGALDAAVQDRLRARLAADSESEQPRPGVGIGTLILVVFAVAGFMAFGLIRDVNPLWRGKALLEHGDYARARAAFTEALNRRVGDPLEAHEQLVLCWLAEGHFEKALDTLAVPGVLQRFGTFAPRADVLPFPEVDSDSGALLPRGHTLNSHPTFVHRAGPVGQLEALVLWGAQESTFVTPLADTRDRTGPVTVEWPEEWRPLPPGCVVVWGVSTEGQREETTFTVASKAERREVGEAFARFLTRGVPSRAREFFRGHYYLNKGFLAKSASEFGLLHRKFPDRAYPRQQLERVAAALALDPSVFLR